MSKSPAFINWSEWQIREWCRCKVSLVYFAATYVWIEMKETGEIIPFNALPYRIRILENYQAGNNMVVDKCRRAGASWTFKTGDAWEHNFYPGTTALGVSRNEEEAIDLLDKEKFILSHLALHDADDYEEATKADWLCGFIEIDNKRQFAIGWHNDKGKVYRLSKCDSLTTTGESGRAKGAGRVLLDEWAFTKPNDVGIWRSISPMMVRGTIINKISTPNGIGGDYYTTVMRARKHKQQGTLDQFPYTYIEVDWWDTEITQEDYDRQTAEMSEDDIRQEFKREFLTTGSPAFDSNLVVEAFKPPQEFPDVEEYLETYREQNETLGSQFAYVSGIDNRGISKVKGRGTRKDYNSFTPLTLEGVQAGHFYSKESISVWSGYLVNTGQGEEWINGKTTEHHQEFPGLCYVEGNSGGIQVYTNHRVPKDGYSQLVLWDTNVKTKPKMVNDFIKALEGRLVTITDYFTYECVLAYQDFGNGQYGAPDGSEYYDDPVISIMLAWQALLRLGGRNINWVQISTDSSHRLTVEQAEKKAIQRLPGGPVVTLSPENLRVSDAIGIRRAPSYPDHQPLQSELDQILRRQHGTVSKTRLHRRG